MTLIFYAQINAVLALHGRSSFVQQMETITEKNSNNAEYKKPWGAQLQMLHLQCNLLERGSDVLLRGRRLGCLLAARWCSLYTTGKNAPMKFP